MATSYLELSDEKLAVQLTNFSSKIEVYGPTFGLSAAEVTIIKNDADYFFWTVVNYKKMATNKKNWTAFKTILKTKPNTLTVNPAPIPAALDPAPTAVAPGIIYRFTSTVNRIKAHPAYTTAIGKNLGVEQASASKANNDHAKPVLKAIVRGGKVDLKWKKGKFTGILIEKDSGQGYVALDKDFQPPFTDPTPLPEVGQTALWKYRASYLINDNKVGLQSDVVTITVTG